MVKIRVDCYEAGSGAVGGLGTFHNWLFPGLVKLYGDEVKTFSMDTKGELPQREDYKGVIIRRPQFPVSEDQAHAMVYDIFKSYGIDSSYLTPTSLSFGYGTGKVYFTKFCCVSPPYRISEADLLSFHDWQSYLRSGLDSLLFPRLPQDLGLHATEPGRRQGIFHHNFAGTSEKLKENEISLNINNNLYNSFHEGERIIRDLEFVLTFKILKKLRDNSALMTVSKIHRKEYLLGVKAHGGKPEEIQNRVYPMYHGVDTDFLRPFNNGKKEFTVGMIGRCEKNKGFDMIPAVTTILAHESPEIKIHISTLTGLKNSLDNPLYRWMKETELNFPKNLKVEDTVYDEEGKLNLLNSWHALMALSKYEPQGQIDLEAKACGIVPIVGVGGLREKTIDGFDGVWINPFEPRQIADKIIQLYRSANGGPPYKGENGYEAKYEELCKNARESAEKTWDVKKRVEAHHIKNQYLLEGKAEAIREELNDILVPNPSQL